MRVLPSVKNTMKSNILSLLAGLTIISTAAFGQTIPNYAEADLVLGQRDFVTRFVPNTPSAVSLLAPTSVVVDPVTRKVFVADSINGRVLRYPNADSLANGAAAEAVFGKENLTSDPQRQLPDPGPSESRLNEPISIFLDFKGRLWVADGRNNRVLMFDSASLRSSGASADRVIGQPDFSSRAAGTTQAMVKVPTDMCVDSSDRLWVADGLNSRVLRFDNITEKANGANADGVLGQVNFTSSAPVGGASGLNFPSDVTISKDGNLFVTTGNYNVMRFNNAAALRNGGSASAVLGKPNFDVIPGETVETTEPSAANMSGPSGAWITPDDSLWVADASRVLRFDNASTKPSGANADGVIGQPDFISSTSVLTRRGVASTYKKPFVDSKGSLWITDYNYYRVLRFSPDKTAPLLTLTGKLPKTTAKKSLLIKGTASDANGVKLVQYRLGNGPLISVTGTTNWTLTTKLKKGKNILTIFATDNAGNISTSQVIKIVRK
jgi:sugar lactone lactonase YvrE